MKKLVYFLSVLMALAFSNSAYSGGHKTIALIQINQQAQFFTDMNKGAKAQAKKNGHKMVIFNANNDPTAQNNAIETFIQQGVDGLIVVAIDTNGIMSAVIQAANAGIPVVAIDAILPDGPHISQVGVNNYGAGVMIANNFLEYVDSNMGGKAKIGIVGALNSTIQNVRQKGFTDTLSKNPKVNVVGIVDGRNVSEKAMSAAENLFTANPSMNAVYTTGEPALVGAIAATEAQGLEKEIKIFGWDLTSHSINGIEQGYVISVVQQSPYNMGTYAVNVLKDTFNGKSVPRVIDVPITLVTKSNVSQFK
ncbi:substrate-binding domain-containing protein [Deltaproteobacteria bacterium]|jgi:ribose transport system substrate-binding protein|nr:substrate-binding domain-containing protein [Deltaproteobacteria bacterium]|tara:strand:+ start:121 stop:1041 length:921 start_codon:yes stop_codon:yes gene_type:complete